MRSSDEKKSLMSYLPDLGSMLVAILVAMAMWYLVSVRDRLEAQVEINVDYYDIPANLVVTDGLVSKIQVRLKGPETLLRSIPRERLVQAINLSGIKKGVTVVPLASEGLGPAFRAFDVVDIQPPRIVVKADTLMERNVPLRTIVDLPLRGGALTVENVSVSPATSILRGPEEVISRITSLPLTIVLDPKAAGTTVEQNVTLDTPSLVTANPTTVRVRYTITSGRTIVSRRCPIVVIGDNSHQYNTSPREMNLMVEVPEALAKNTQYLKQLEITVLPPDMEIGESKKVRARLKLPDGMTVLNPTDEEITVTRVKKSN